ASVVAKVMRTKRASRISGALNGRNPPALTYTAFIGDCRLSIEGAQISDGQLSLRIDGEPYVASTNWLPGDPLMHLRDADGEHAIQIARVAGGYRLGHGGSQAVVTIRRPEAATLAELMPKKAAPDTSKMLL